MGIFSLLILTFGLASGYNLNSKTLALIEKPGLFGWSLVQQGEYLYVGAPEGGAGETGKVFQCRDLTTKPTCSELHIKADDSLRLNGSWFGGSLAASKDTLYSCAFRYNWTNFADGSHTWPGPNILATGTGTGTVSVSMARTGNVRDLSPLQWPEPRLHQDLVLGTGTDQN